MSRASNKGHSCLLDQAFHGVIVLCHHKLLPKLVADSRYQIDRGSVSANHWLQVDDLSDVDGHRVVSIEVGEFNEHARPLRCTGRFNMRALTQIGNEIVKGVVDDFCDDVGTGAGRRVQDMTELEIFG